MELVGVKHLWFYSPQAQRGKEEPQPSQTQGNKLKDVRWLMQ